MPPGLRSRDRVPGPYRFRLLGGACRGRDRPGPRGFVARTRRPGAPRGEGTSVVTATAILDLERAGFTREQVEALAKFLDTQVATKADIARLELKLAETKADLLKWMFGIAAGQLGLLFAALKLFPSGHP